MQLDTTAALGSVAISAGIGFGLAFYIERKINSRMQRKSQKILVSIAMTSFGYGLTAFLNEVIGFPLQGLHIRYDKLAVYLGANILILPIVLLVIANSMGLKNKAVDVALNVQSNPVAVNSFKYVLMLAGVVSIAYFGYAAFEGSSSGATYDVYTRVDYKNCSSPFKEKPFLSMKFSFKKDTNEIFATYELDENGVKRQKIQKLKDCSVLDAKNWTCGSDSFFDGTYSYSYTGPVYLEGCAPKVVKR